MADGSRFARLEENLVKLAALQESQAILIEKRNLSLDSLTNSVKEFTITLHSLDAKVEQELQRNVSPLFPNHQPIVPDYTNQVKSMRLVVPRFSGENPFAWVSQVQRYFDFYNTPNPKRLVLASYYLDADALDWYNGMKKTQSLNSWHEFLLAIVKQFGRSRNVDSLGEFRKLLQTGSLSESHHLFDQLSEKIIEVPEPIVASCFVSDLRSELRKELQVYKPHSLVHAMSLARLFDGKNRDHHFSFKGHDDPYREEKTTAYSRSTNLPPLLPKPFSDNLPKPVKTQPSVPIKHFSVETQPSVPIKNFSVEEVHYQILKEAWEQIERPTEEEKYYQILLEECEQIEHLNGEQKRRRTSEYFLVSATVATFHGPEHVPIFSLPAASIANQSMLTLLATIHCQLINQRGIDVSLKYWFSGTGFRWKNPRRVCRLWSTYSDPLLPPPCSNKLQHTISKTPATIQKFSIGKNTPSF